MTTLKTTVSSSNLAKHATVWMIKYAFLLAFAGMVFYFSSQSENFLTGSNIMNIAKGSVIVLLMALALTLVISSGGIDLSIGIALDFGAWFAIVSMSVFGVPWQLALVIALAGGAMVGLLNAFLIVKLGVTPFLATLGTFFIGRSLQQIGTNGGANVNFRNAPEGFQNITAGNMFGLPNTLVIGFVVLIAYFVFIELSKHGRRINALGIQDSAAKVSGIPTNRYRVLVYVLAGSTAAIAGILLSSGLRIYTPLAGFSYLLDGIAAVFIGASMHSQNRPNVIGTLIGVLFLATLSTGLDIIGIDFNLKAALKGIVLVLAIVLASVVSKRLPLVQAWFERSTEKKINA